MEDNKNTATKFQEETDLPYQDKTVGNLKENNLSNKQKNPIEMINQKEYKNNLFQISRKIRYFIYIIELFCLFNFDQGAIAASTKEIKNNFKMTDKELGSFGGISFLGTTLGGIVSLSVINKINRRYLILIFLIGSICSLFFPTIISSKFFLIFCRVITGFSQSFMSIYLPVWVNQFGIFSKKSFMMSIIQIPSALGYLLGYIFAVFTSWKITFRINALTCFIYFICFIFSKNIYFYKNIFPKKMVNLEKLNASLNKTNLNEDEISFFEDIGIENVQLENESILNHTKICFKSKLFCFSCLSLVTLLLILSGLQFWINDFLENSIQILDKKERLFYFVIIIVITMIGAPLTTGIILQKIGGYQSHKSIFLPLFCCIISLILSNLLFIFSYKIIVAILIGGYLFSGCIMISSLNGILMTSVDKKYTGSASSISNLLYNICGRLIGPYFYGVFRSMFGIKSKIPMIALLDIKFLTLFSLYNYLKNRRKIKQ